MNPRRLVAWPIGRVAAQVAALLAGLLAGLITPAAQAQARFDFDTTPGHLSRQVVPTRYALRLDLDPARDTFSGQANIAVRVRSAQAAIEVHAFELTATSSVLVTPSGTTPLTLTVQPESQTWRLARSDGRPIAAGEHHLELGYTGRVHVAGEGLYLAPYEAAGVPRRMLATQLEPIFGRTLFPGFDEPAFRASFELSVRAPAAYDVVSNMPRVSRTRHGETTLHWFAPTPPMPSYLVSVAVGHFERLEGRAAGVPVALLVAEGKREQARFALKVVQQVLPHYARYFGVPYALPKLDLMAVPSVRWGAMEDWGLISYAENNVLVDPARSSPQTTRDAWATIAHEVAHQWFGNLVTAASWEEIWLNEAFATWLQDKTTDHFNPAWKVRLLARRPLDRAMALDAGAATRAIRSGPVRETAVTDVFDHITYGKGGAVLGMLEQWLGPDRFRRGLVAYMKSQRLSNATAGDLWFHIGRASGLDVAGVAASWTDQQGFPLVRASRRCESGRQTLELAQSRFRSDDTAAASAQLWKIPLRLAFGGSERTVLLDTPTRRVELGPCGDTPVLVNAGGIGFYRVAYDAETLQGLTRRFVALADVDRITLLSDSFARVQSGDLPLAAYFALLERLPDVADASRTMLWSTAKSQLEFLDTTLSGGPAQQRLRALGRALLAPQLERLGWAGGAGEDAATAEWRGTLISLLAQFDHAPTIAQATRAFDDDDAGRRTLPASLREPVVVATGMHADRAHFDRLRARLAAASGEEERWLFVRALASGRDAAQADELLAASIAGIWPANIASSMAGMIARLSPTLGEQAYRFSVENWKPLAEQAGTWGRNFVLPGAAEGFHDSDTASRLVADQRRLVGADGDALAAQEADNIRLRSAVRRREAPALEKALAD